MNKITDSGIANYKKYILIFWGLFIFSIVFVVFLFWSISKGYVGYIPPIEDIQNPKSKFETQLISSDGVVLSSIYSAGENRTYIGYNDLSPTIVNALLATEDIRFAKHSGIDAKGIARAIFGVLTGRSSGGGSTITQQLAKQLYTERAYGVPGWKRVFQKLNEYVIAVKLERFYTKEEILVMYLNKFDFLNNAIGIQTASRVYFNCRPSDLQVEQSALLVGMLQNPSLYNPIRFAERATFRRNVVLGQMGKAGFISETELDSLRNLPVELDYHRVDHKTGPAPYMREFLRKFMSASEPIRKNYRGWDVRSGKFEEDSIQLATNPLYGWINKNFKPDGSRYNLYTDGLKIYTTIDSRMQQYAYDAMSAHLGNELQPAFFKQNKSNAIAPYAHSIGSGYEDRMKRYRELIQSAMRNTPRYKNLKAAKATEDSILKVFNTPVQTTVFSWNGDVDTLMSPLDSIKYMKHFLRSGMMAMDPHNGHVKVYIGGIDYSYFQYDMVYLGRRQVGSTIKPFLYTLAMQEGFTPCSRFLNAPITIYDGLGRPWTPKDDGKDNKNEMVSLKWGLAHSNNYISARIMNEFKPKTLADLLRSMGVTSHIDEVPALCLGTPDLSILELVRGYSSFVNRGVMVHPLFVTKIEDKDGNIVSVFKTQKKEVINEITAWQMVDLLRGVVDTYGGTASRLRWKYNLTGPIGGKTGTTQDQSDGWFMSITPGLVSGVWVGGEEPTIRFYTLSQGQGANMALPIWANFMKKVYDDPSLGYDANQEFERPAGFNTVYDCEKTNGAIRDDNENPLKSNEEEGFF